MNKVSSHQYLSQIGIVVIVKQSINYVDASALLKSTTCYCLFTKYLFFKGFQLNQTKKEMAAIYGTLPYNLLL